ncbi:MAG: 50S ribosomal protein L21 [Thermoleophilia bacterium]|nr:50S ribosomal protein L21 [Thermoleophilia bacterium]
MAGVRVTVVVVSPSRGARRDVSLLSPIASGAGRSDVSGEAVAEYAVIALGGKQYRVREGERIVVDRIAAEPGESISPKVLAIGGADGISDGGTVTAEVEEHVLGPKITVLTYRAKKDSKRKMGHRSRLSRVRITGIGG